MSTWLPLGLVLTARLSTLQASLPTAPSPAPSLEVIATDGAGPEKDLLRREGLVSLLMMQTPVEQHLLEFYVVDPNHHPRQQRH
jgi:hypothetical protein